jgi:hypothetical protein
VAWDTRWIPGEKVYTGTTGISVPDRVKKKKMTNEKQLAIPRHRLWQKGMIFRLWNLD